MTDISSSTMSVEDDLCNELFSSICQQERCANHLMALATELEKMREVMTTGRFVGNTTTVVASAALIGSGIATFLTRGLAAPLLLAATRATGVFAVTAGSVTSLTFSLLENWKSSKTMKSAEETVERLKKIHNNIERLKEKLTEECESQEHKASSTDELQFEIIVRILRAMAKRSERDLRLSRLRALLRSDHISTPISYRLFKANYPFFHNVSSLLAVLGYSLISVKTAATKAAAQSLKAVVKGTGQVTGGLIGLVMTVPDLINNCDDLIKNKHETEASTSLRTKANAIREAVQKLKKQLNELQEMLNQIPEMECHVDLGQEMLGSQTYTHCIEYKQPQNQDKKIQNFIFLSTKDTGVTGYGSTSKHKSNDHKNKRLKSTSTALRTSSLDQLRKRAIPRKPPPKSSTKVKEFQFHLPKITMSNVRSLPNKMEEISEMMDDVEYFDSDLMFFTETWLNSNSRRISLEGYTPYRLDRDAQLTQKRRGGGQIILVNEAWAMDVEVENIKMTPDYELIVVSITPHDHPEGVPPLTFIHVNVPGPDFNQAAIDITGFYYDALEMSGGGPVFLLGDFNQCDVTPLLSNLEQYVTCPTRSNNTLDLCFGNVPGAYRSVCRPPLGRSDHNVIHLIPKDKSDENQPSSNGECTNDHTQPKNQ